MMKNEALGSTIMTADEPMSFTNWVAYVFDHPVVEHPDSRILDTDVMHLQASDVVAYMTQTFEECETVLRPFSEAQVAQGLSCLISADLSDCALALSEPGAPLPDRLRCIEAITTLFERYFAPRCSPHLSHLEIERSREGVGALNGVCYIWWDVLPLSACMGLDRPGDPDAAYLGRTIFAVLQRILKIDSLACQESALFGLVQCVGCYPEADEIIDDFVDRHPVVWERFNPVLRERLFGGR